MSAAKRPKRDYAHDACWNGSTTGIHFVELLSWFDAVDRWMQIFGLDPDCTVEVARRQGKYIGDFALPRTEDQE